MTAVLFAANTPQSFWRVIGDAQPSADEWQRSIEDAACALPAAARAADVDTILENTLGEGQFGPDHWNLSLARRVYYVLKPALPRPLTRRLRQLQRSSAAEQSALDWPIEPRYADFTWNVMRAVLASSERPALQFIHFWPGGRRFAFVLTHDIETAEGQAHVRAVAGLELEHGFRSSFNFVPERYRVDRELMGWLRAQGFEVGVHGLKHDGKLYSSHTEFMRRAARINQYLKDFDAVGFRSPLTHRQPEWLQALDMEYDLSFFDTDPFEPIAGGTMSVWPFEIGRFVELPYTLVQDYTLTHVLGESTPRIWLDKVDFIERFWGLALVNSHPDYLREPVGRRVYEEFLGAMRERRAEYWHALPRDVARWWRSRSRATAVESLPGAVAGTVAAGSDGRNRMGHPSQVLV